MRIPFLDLRALHRPVEGALRQAFEDVLQSGWYIQGEHCRRFEKNFAEYCGTAHAVGTASGLDALTLILRGWMELGRLKEGDEVIVPANTYIASVLAVTHNRLVPRFVEPDPVTYLLDPLHVERALTPRTRVVMAVHLYGQTCDMAALGRIARDHGLLLMEDSAQAHGARFEGRRAGALSDASGFSFYPGKNLGALGDGGIVTTDDEALASMVRTLANYGSDRKYHHRYRGFNSRLDELQAALLDVKLKRLEADNERRKAIAREYLNGIVHEKIVLPAVKTDSVWHQFVLRTTQRDRLQRYLTDRGIETLIHYPVPPHKQPAYEEYREISLPITDRLAKEVLSIPIYPTLSDTEVSHIVKVLNAYR